MRYSNYLLKLANLLKTSLRTPSMEGKAEEYHVPWELVTYSQNILENYVSRLIRSDQSKETSEKWISHRDYASEKLIWKNLKDETPLPSEITNIGFFRKLLKQQKKVPSQVQLHSLSELHKLSSIHRGTIFYDPKEKQKVELHLFAGLGVKGVDANFEFKQKDAFTFWVCLYSKVQTVNYSAPSDRDRDIPEIIKQVASNFSSKVMNDGFYTFDQVNLEDPFVFSYNFISLIQLELEKK